jgi:hypothetical protein
LRIASTTRVRHTVGDGQRQVFEQTAADERQATHDITATRFGAGSQCFMPFKRHLEQPFIEALNKLHDDQNSWWHALVRDEQVFMGIRSNAINAYAGGASIARIEWSNRRLQLRVNRKFLVLPKPTSGDDS